MIMAPLNGIQVSDVTGQNQVAIDDLPSDTTIGHQMRFCHATVMIATLGNAATAVIPIWGSTWCYQRQTRP